MSILTSVWSNLVFTPGSGNSSDSLSWLVRRKKQLGDGKLKYVSKSAYKSVIVHTLKRMAMATVQREIQSLLPKYKRYVRNQQLAERDKVSQANRDKLIDKQMQLDKPYGKIDITKVGGDKYELIAKTNTGRPVPESLILWYEGEEKDKWDFTDIKAYYSNTNQSVNERDWYSGTNITAKRRLSYWNPSIETSSNSKKVKEEPTIQTTTIFHIDLAPEISMSSSKNLVMTTVQGRDFSRKELVSGGDFTFSISGNIVSDQMGVYPEEAVKRFLKIMQYSGIVNIRYFMLGAMNVDRVIIKEFSLGQCEYKNIQPYSFSCVAIEPNDTIKLAADAIATVNQQLEVSNLDGWYNSILQSKMGGKVAQTVSNATANLATKLLDATFDELLPNI